jgi:Uma2 family endonuclease
MMSALPKKLYTLEEYLELDKNSEERYEFFEGTVRGVGEVFAMSGGSLNHGRIIANVTRRLSNDLLGRDCEVLPADVCIKVPAALPYPDLSVVCGEAQVEDFAGQQLYSTQSC